MSENFSFNEIKELCEQHDIELAFKDMSAKKLRAGFLGGLPTHLYRKLFYYDDEKGPYGKDRTPYNSFERALNEKTSQYMSTYTLVFKKPGRKKQYRSGKNLKELISSIDFDMEPFCSAKKILYLPYNQYTLFLLMCRLLHKLYAERYDNENLEITIPHKDYLKKYNLENKEDIVLIVLYHPDKFGFSKRRYIRSQKEFNKLKLEGFNNVFKLVCPVPKQDKVFDVINILAPEVLDGEHLLTEPSIKDKHIFSDIVFLISKNNQARLSYDQFYRMALSKEGK